MHSVPFITNPFQNLHATGSLTVNGAHYDTREVPRRIEKLLEALRCVGEIGTPIDHGLKPILDIHDPDYIEFLKSTPQILASRSIPLAIPDKYILSYHDSSYDHLRIDAGAFAFDDGSPILPGTWEAAYWSAQSAIHGASLLMNGTRLAYSLCRPSGHHAGYCVAAGPDGRAKSSHYGGFCFLNNAAIAARALSELGKVAILDVDFHHGNGTQCLFYDKPVLFVSLHGDPRENIFPHFWGHAEEVGVGAGLGFNFNYPLAKKTPLSSYLRTLELGLRRIEEFKPDFLVVSLGFDILKGDSYGSFEYLPEDLAPIGERIGALRTKTLLVQEGGYQPDLIGSAALNFLNGFRRTHDSSPTVVAP